MTKLSKAVLILIICYIQNMIKIAIIGAGLTSLTIANQLKDFANITIFEKSRGVGGRIATRYAEKFEFDHGIPFFEGQDSESIKLLENLKINNVIQEWQIRYASSNINNKICNVNDNSKCYVGIPKMNSIGKYLLKNINILTETKITKISNSSVLDEQGNEYKGFDFIITATPPAQAVQILPEYCSYLQQIQKFEMFATFSVMIGFENNVMQSQNWDVAYFQNSLLKMLVANHNKPLRNTKPSFIALTNYEWTENNLEADKSKIGNIVTSELEDIFIQKLNPQFLQVHRWLYSQSKPHDSQDLFFIDKNLISCGDWCIDGNIKSAFKSGLAVSDYIKSILPKSV